MTEQQHKAALELMSHALGLNYKPISYRNHLDDFGSPFKQVKIIDK